MEAAMIDRDGTPERENPFDAREPARDAVLGTLLHEIVGTPPDADVDWMALAHRISGATVALVHVPWWGYAARWERRAIPIAVAAGLAGAVALWGLGTPPQLSAATAWNADLVTAVATGVPVEDVARSFARSVTVDPAIEAHE
jgi:hypothetical protein